ncbi:STM3941 family protein [Ferruginibacter yonginensis]|uniref:STM3941 family protein n=1 Tax=Ferruginibacter yonginensis TaxID=1310416 RepID=A0ABV8QU49_9BACT
MTENKIEISLSKTKLIKLLIFSVLFLLGGLWMIITNPQTNNSVFNNLIIKTIASYGSTIMGLLGIYFFTKKLFDKKPGLILSEEGIYDNTSAFNFGLIPWTDISEIYEKSIQASIASKQHFVTIGLVDPEKYITRVTNILKRRLLMVNSKSYGSPIHISTNGLKTNHKDLFKLVTEYFNKYKSAV